MFDGARGLVGDDVEDVQAVIATRQGSKVPLGPKSGSLRARWMPRGPIQELSGLE